MEKASAEHIGSTPRVLAITINIIIVWAPPETDPRQDLSALSGSDPRRHHGGVESNNREGKVAELHSAGSPRRTCISESFPPGARALGIYTPATTTHWSRIACPGTSSVAWKVPDLVWLLGAAPEMDTPDSSPRLAVVPQGCC